jgi:hypothetical protein
MEEPLKPLRDEDVKEFGQGKVSLSQRDAERFCLGHENTSFPKTDLCKHSTF